MTHQLGPRFYFLGSIRWAKSLHSSGRKIDRFRCRNPRIRFRLNQKGILKHGFWCLQRIGKWEPQMVGSVCCFGKKREKPQVAGISSSESAERFMRPCLRTPFLRGKEKRLRAETNPGRRTRRVFFRGLGRQAREPRPRSLGFMKDSQGQSPPTFSRGYPPSQLFTWEPP